MKNNSITFGPFFQDCFITVTPGVVQSNLKVVDAVNADDDVWNAAIDGMESLLLAMATAGIELDTKEIRESIETALDAIANHYSE